MKRPIEYLGNVNAFTTRKELYNIGKQMQIDAWNEAINATSNNLMLLIDGKPLYSPRFIIEKGDTFYFETEIEIDKQEILNLLKS